MAEYIFPTHRVSQPALKETVLCGILQGLSLIAVCGRIWARRMKKKRLEINDYAIFVALFFCVSLLTIAIISTVWSGKGYHTHDIEPAYRSRVFVAFTAGQPVWGAANTAVKFSILHFYLTFFQDVRFRRVCYVTMIITTCYFMSVFLETFLTCKPVRYNWDKTIKGTCTKHAGQEYLVAGILNLMIDIFVVVLPMPMLWRLRMSKPKKIGVISMFSLGAVICIVSLLRVVYIARMDLHDFHYTYADLGMWSIVEPQLGVINACLPVMRPVLLRLWKSKAPQSSLSSSQNRDSRNFRKINENTVDKLYPLETVMSVGVTNSSVPDSAVEIQR